MNDREKALEAALRDIARQRKTDEMPREDRHNGDFEGACDTMIDVARAAIAMPATERTAWEAGRDAAEKAVTGLIESNAHDSYTGRLYALNKAREAIRNLTPPEDAP